MEIGNDLALRTEIARLAKNELPDQAQRARLKELGVQFAALTPDQGFYRCDLLVFGAILKEPWMHPAMNFQLIHNTHDYLLYRGYKPTDKPQTGDVTIYYRQNRVKEPLTGRTLVSEPADALHFGVMYDGKVISKWGQGSVYLHEIGSILLIYGDTVKFYAKETSPVLRAIRTLRAAKSVQRWDEIDRQRLIHIMAEHPERKDEILNYRSWAQMSKAPDQVCAVVPGKLIR